LLNKRI